MKIFVPRFRHHMPHVNNKNLIATLWEIAPSDLDATLDFWEATDKVSETKPLQSLFKTHIKDICATPPKKRTLETVLRRPHITFHGGSKAGAPHCKDIFAKGAYETGAHTARNGFNGWYGGGDSGLMGLFAKGFNEEIERNGHLPDQYLVQVIPAPFIRGVKSSDGMKPANEGLCWTTDVAIIMPDFDTRLHLLNSRCIAAASNPGGTGTIEETSGVMRLIKTGLQSMLLYLLNPHIPDDFDDHYFDLFKMHIERSIARGLENPNLLSRIRFPETAAEMFDDLMQRLSATNSTPNEIYESYLTQHDATPGIPLFKPRAQVENTGLRND